MSTITSQTLYPTLAHDDSYAPESRVWVYVAARPLTDTEAGQAQTALDAFARRWTSHNQALLARAEVFHNQIIVLMADETRSTGVGGCSIDSSVHFLEALGRELGVDLFDRMQFGWVDNGRIRIAPRAEAAEAVQSGAITADTPMLNTLAATRRDLVENWLAPFGKSWHRRVL